MNERQERLLAWALPMATAALVAGILIGRASDSAAFGWTALLCASGAAMLTRDRARRTALLLAVCALGCTLTRISSQKEIYLLSPETVMVVPYDGIRRMSDQEINARWPDPDAVNDRYGWNQQGGYQERSSNYGRRGYAGRYDEGYGSYQSAYAR